MPADRLLGTLLRSLQTSADQQDTPRLLGTASSLLTTLNNPLNVTLLTSQLLSGRAIWVRPDDLKTCTQCLSVFHSAAQALIRHEHARAEKTADTEFEQLQLEHTLPKDDWVKAVVTGADEHSPRWRHLLVLGGLLLGFGPSEDENLSSSMRRTLEKALVAAINLSLAETPHEEAIGLQTLVFVLNYCFPYLADEERVQLDYDALLPVLMMVAFHSRDGLRSGYFLGAIDMDVQPVSDSRFQWPANSQTFLEVQKMLSGPILSGLGPLSRLIGHSIEQVQTPTLVISSIDELELFAKTLHLQWRQNKLSEIDPSEESTYLDTETQDKTSAELWKLLRSTLYATVIILRSALGRLLGDAYLAREQVAPGISTQALRTLRYFYFITTRMNASSFSQYTFVNLTAIDVLASYPATAESFILSIKPGDTTLIPKHPLDRCLDLFFLNTAEHFALILPSDINGRLLMSSARPYLSDGANSRLLPIFEAAHSLTLAVFSAPQNADIASNHLQFYVENLFKVFPHNLTSRQFRMAFRALLKLASPPNPLATTQPSMAAILLDLLRERSLYAGITPIFPQSTKTQPPDEPAEEFSEQGIMVMTVIDTLTEISLDLLDEWLPLAADMVNKIQDFRMRNRIKEHFWHTLIDGGMDPERSQICHSWWSTEGGREQLLYGMESATFSDPELAMSGGLPDDAAQSKL